MGILSIFSGKRPIDRVIKYFDDKGIELEQKNDKYYFEIAIPELQMSLYPYFKLSDSGLLSIIINIRKYDNELDIYKSLNNFNLKSKFFTAKLNENIIYLEYNTIIDNEIIKRVFDSICENVFLLAMEIDEL